MKITLDIPNTVVAAGLTILRGESTHFTLGAYNIGPDEIRDGAIIILPRDEAKESPNSDLPRGCWRVENLDDVRAAVLVTRCKDCEHSKEYEDGLHCLIWGRNLQKVLADDFCSLGMKKSDE